MSLPQKKIELQGEIELSTALKDACDKVLTISWDPNDWTEEMVKQVGRNRVGTIKDKQEKKAFAEQLAGEEVKAFNEDPKYWVTQFIEIAWWDILEKQVKQYCVDNYEEIGKEDSYFLKTDTEEELTKDISRIIHYIYQQNDKKNFLSFLAVLGEDLYPIYNISQQLVGDKIKRELSFDLMKLYPGVNFFEMSLSEAVSEWFKAKESVKKTKGEIQSGVAGTIEG